MGPPPIPSMAQTTPVSLNPPPGVVKTNSPRASEGRFIDAQAVRFNNGKAQKIGGWARQTATPVDGVPRGLHAWRNNVGTEFIAAGTYKKLYVIDRGFALHDITPIASSVTLTNPFTTTNGSKTVNVLHAAHNQQVGNTVNYSGATAVGGLTLNGAFTVDRVVDSNNYQITAATAATSGATGGGTVTAQYEVAIGAVRGAFGLGWGVGPYGGSTYGTPRTASIVFVEPRVWSVDHFGKILLASYNEGGLYSFDPDAINWPRAAIVSDAPTDIRAMFVTPERFVVALRAGMQIHWCVQGDFSTWTPTDTNTANIRGITEGNKLVGGRPLGGGVSLIWSDAALYGHQYTGSDQVFDTQLIGRNCGLISPNGAVVVGGTAYWMGSSNFFLYSGVVQPMPNVEDIRAFVFNTLDATAGYECAAMFNPAFNEVWFFYVAGGASEPGLYVAYSITDRCWTTGSLTRVSGTYFTHGDVRPYWADDQGYLYLHENGNDANGAPLSASLTLAPSGVGDGNYQVDVDGIEPDFFEQAGNITLTINAWDRIRSATDAPLDSETLTVAPTDGLIDCRVAGRYLGMTIQSNTLGGFFRMGKPAVYTAPSGARR
jgi:hypothetical protein